jgi:NAD(P)-dependent dehydrogenase (short-subunit alcohol dehydrogenase family)
MLHARTGPVLVVAPIPCHSFVTVNLEAKPPIDIPPARTVVIAGVGARGQVGEVVARAFATQGASLALIARHADHAEMQAAILSASGFHARGYGCDLADPDSVAALVDTVQHAHVGRVAALVHMAGGFGGAGRVADITLESWNRQITNNLTSAYVTSRAFLPLIRASRGSIVFFASEAMLPGASVANMSAYAVAKMGVATLMRAIAAEERDHGVRANAVAPSAIRTATNIETMGEGARYVEREQVAAVVTFLCSHAASAISGEVIALS